MECPGRSSFAKARFNDAAMPGKESTKVPSKSKISPRDTAA
jgi:hypothetical protein